MPRISKVVDPVLDLRYGHMFDIQTINELDEWFREVRLPKSKEEFSDAVVSREFTGQGHHARQGAVLVQLAAIRETSLAATLVQINMDIMSGMRNCLLDDGRIFINTSGGYFSTRPSLQISDTKTVPIWALPDEKVRILQWPGGEHYYAKIGSQDVIIGKTQKWNSKKEAEEAAEQFLREM